MRNVAFFSWGKVVELFGMNRGNTSRLTTLLNAAFFTAVESLVVFPSFFELFSHMDFVHISSYRAGFLHTINIPYKNNKELNNYITI
jgi:hypothetical protein